MALKKVDVAEMAALTTLHPSAEEKRQVNSEDDVIAWLSTGQRPRSSSRPKSSRRGRDGRKKLPQECWVEPPGPLQAVLDMHAEAVERLHQVTHTSAKLQEHYDRQRWELDAASKQTQFEVAIIAGLESCELSLALVIPKIEDCVVQLLRASMDPEDIGHVHELHRAVEAQLKQEMQDLLERTNKERKIAERLPDALKVTSRSPNTSVPKGTRGPSSAGRVEWGAARAF